MNIVFRARKISGHLQNRRI